MTFQLSYRPETGLCLDWPEAAGISSCPVRVALRGEHTFRVWDHPECTVDSGEEPPRWSEPGLALTFFGDSSESPGMRHHIDAIERDGSFLGYRATAVHERCAVQLEFRIVEETLRISAVVVNTQPSTGRALPLGSLEVRVEGIRPGTDAEYWSAHGYGGRTHGVGATGDIPAAGLSFAHGCIGGALPLLYLHDNAEDAGLQLEFPMGERPIAWLRPSAIGGTPDRAGGIDWALAWGTERLLLPGEAHGYAGTAGIKAYRGRPARQMREWRDAAAELHGLESVVAPEWARRCNIIEFNMNPTAGHPFTRLDDVRCRELLERWKGMGYNAIFAVSSNHVGQNFLSPFDYEPCDAVGGVEGEAQALAWAHELGFHIFLWVTTVGIDRDAPEVAAHRDWFTHRRNGDLFYAWESHAPDYLGYAPDADPLSTGWRAWLKNQVSGIVARGYDGIFIDGCIPRASNHARWLWPGEARNSVEDQVAELADHVRTLGADLFTFVEDESPLLQSKCEMTMGRYAQDPPRLKLAHWDQGMGGGPESQAPAPPHIAPEQARDYILVRQACLLPWALSNDMAEGYLSEASRPWMTQSLFTGMVPKTHSEYVDTPEVYRAAVNVEEPPPAEQAAEHRLRGHAEFLDLLRLCRDEPLLREAPVSIEGVEIEGDAAVVGLLRPGGERCLLAVIQFADRPARVKVRLAEPVDVPAVQRAAAGAPHARVWQVKEIMHSMVETEPARPDSIGGGKAYEVKLGAYGFRLFEMTDIG